MTEVFPPLFLRSLECRLPRVATWPRSRVRGRGRAGFHTPSARRGWYRVPARRGFILYVSIFMKATGLI